MTIYGYTRVSTLDQVADGQSSIADQERKIRGIAMQISDVDPVMFSDPGVTGSMPLGKRPAGGELMAALKSGDTLISAKLDRLFRSASDALAMAEQFRIDGIKLIVANMGSDPVTDSGTAKLFFGMLALMAEFEKGMILERTADGRKGKKARGGHTGGQAPFGFRVTGKGRSAMLEPNPAEQAAVARAIELRAEGMPLRKISAALFAEGHKSRSGMPITTSQIFRLAKQRGDFTG